MSASTDSLLTTLIRLHDFCASVADELVQDYIKSLVSRKEAEASAEEVRSSHFFLSLLDSAGLSAGQAEGGEHPVCPAGRCAQVQQGQGASGKVQGDRKGPQGHQQGHQRAAACKGPRVTSSSYHEMNWKPSQIAQSAKRVAAADAAASRLREYQCSK